MSFKTMSLGGADCMPMLAAIVLYWIVLGIAALVLAVAVEQGSGWDAHYLAASVSATADSTTSTAS